MRDQNLASNCQFCNVLCMFERKFTHSLFFIYLNGDSIQLISNSNDSMNLYKLRNEQLTVMYHVSFVNCEKKMLRKYTAISVFF